MRITKDCISCGVCFEVCPWDAVEIMPDESTFAKFVINPDKCKDCGTCIDQCGSGAIVND